MPFAQWRPLILASAVTAALAGAVVVQTLTQGDDDDPPATPAATETAPVGDPTATATTPPLPQAPIAEVTNPLIRRVFEAGELVDVTNALGYLSAETGAIETWAAEGDHSVRSSRDGALLMTTDPGSPDAHVLVERATEKAFRLAPGIVPLVETAHGGLIIVGISNDGGFDTAILDLRNQEFRALGVAADEGSAFLGYAAADGRRAIMHAGSTIAVVDMVANTAIAIGTTFDAGDYSIELLPGGLGFRVVPVDSDEAARWFSWEGDEVTDSPPPGRPTQNGRYFAEEANFGPIRSTGMGAYAALSYVTVHDRSTGEDVVRYLGASLVPLGASWNASGDALVVEVPEGYHVVNLEGAIIATIEDPEHWLNPVPSPVINNLYGTREGTIINTTRGVAVEPLYRDDVTLHSQWSDRPGELIVTVTTAGKGRSWPHQVLPFEPRTPPFDTPPRLTAIGDTCVPVFDLVGPSAAESGCIDAGTFGTVSEAPNPLSSGGDEPADVAGVRDADGVTWLHLEFDGGQAGWVDASRLTWAE